jgi:glycosyltransferase involved in cell wall biosynthesis
MIPLKMQKKPDKDKLKVMMIYGWQSNPYAKCVLGSLLKNEITISFVTRKTLGWRDQEMSCGVYRIFPDHRDKASHLSIFITECIALIKLISLLFTTKPDIIHYQAIRIPKSECIFFLLLKILRKKVSFTAHDTVSLNNSSFENFILKKIARYCDVLFVHTEYSKRMVKERWGISDKKIYLVPHGGYDSCYNSPISKESSRKNLGYQDSDYILLFFGTIRRYKGLDFLIPAVARAITSVPNLKLIIAGQAHEKGLSEHYKKMISELHLEHAIDYHDRFIKDEEVAEFFSSCDMAVLPYVQIDQSGILCLAFTFGRPVIATSVGGLPEMVRDGETGYIVPPANVHILEDKIIKGSQDKQHLEKMGLQARKLIEDKYTWENLADLTVKAYNDIL